MFKMEQLDKLGGCRRLEYILQLGFSTKELAVIAGVGKGDIHRLFRRTSIPDPDKKEEYGEWLLYDKLYVVYSVAASLLKLAGYRADADERIQDFLVETSLFRGTIEEPPWYPLPDIPGRRFPLWQPKNLRGYLLEGRMVAVQNALVWFHEH